MRILLPLLLFIGCLLTSTSEAQNWRWAQRHGGDSVELTRWGAHSPPIQDRLQGWNSVVDLATDPQNNIYAVSIVLGKYLDLNGLPLSGYGKSDMLLSSYTCDGVLRWSKIIGSNMDSDIVVGVRCSELGVFVSGMTNSNFATGSTGCHFSTDTVTGNTSKNIFLAKWDFNGTFQWLRMPQPDTISLQNATRCALMDMDANPVGDTMYLFCYLNPGTYANGQYNVTTAGTYVLKYAGTGAFAGGVGLPYRKLFNDNSGLTMARWSYNHPLNQFIVIGIGNYTLANSYDIGGTQIGRTHAYLANFNGATGGLNYLLHDTNAAATLLIRKVATDQKGDVYVSGNSTWLASFNGQSYPNTLVPVVPIGYINTSDYAPFVMKINGKTGAPIWTTKSQATSAHGLNICLRKKELLLTGEYKGTLAFPTASISNNPAVDTNDAFTAFLDTATGAVRRMNTLKAKSPVPLLFNTVILDRKGSFICGGNFNDTLTLGNTRLVETHPSIALPGSKKRFDAWIGKLGYANCNCSISANYKVVSNFGTTSFVAYTGSTNLDSLVWSWGDGTKSVYKSNYTATISHPYASTGRYQVCVTAYNDTCSESQYCGMLPLSVGSALPEGVSVYPNPTTRDLFIEGLSGGSARIVSVTGQSLMEVSIRSEKQSVYVGHLPAGYYLIMLQDKAGRPGQRKFIKQ